MVNEIANNKKNHTSRTATTWDTLKKSKCDPKSRGDAKPNERCNYYKTTVTSWRPGSKCILCPVCKEEGIISN